MLPFVLFVFVLVGIVAAVVLSRSDDQRLPSPAPRGESAETPLRERVELRAQLPTRQAGSLDVLVIDEHGEPIVGATIEARNLPETLRRSTDASGIARLRGLPTGHVTVVAAAPGRAEAPPVDVALPPGIVVARTILLERALRLRVRVIDGDGEPLAGISVYANPHDGSAFRSVITGPDGRCEFDSLPTGDVELLTSPQVWNEYASIRVPFDEELTLLVPVRRAIEGSVTDRSSGLPIAGAGIGWGSDMTSSPHEFADRATTDEDGRYRVFLVDLPNEWEYIHAHAPGYVEDGSVPLRPPKLVGGPWRADLMLRRTGVVDLVVRTEDGRPADVTIVALGDRHYMRFDPDTNGRATLDHFSPGVVQLTAIGIGWSAIEPAELVIPERGREVVSLVAKTRRPTVIVSGIVVDARGLPLGDSVVSGDQIAPVVTDDSGSFSLRVPDTAWRHDDVVYLRVRRGAEPWSSHRIARREVVGDDAAASVTLTYEELAVIQGRLVDESGHALATAVLRGLDGRIPVGADGRFRFTTHARKVWLRAESPGREAYREDVDAAAGEVVNVGDVVVPLLPILDGRVTDDAGAPVEGALVFVAQTATRTGEDGAFHTPFDGRVISVAAPGHRRARIDSPSGSNITVVLHRFRTLSGTVRFEDGTPVRRTLVHAGKLYEGLTAVTDDSGRFVIREFALSGTTWMSVLPLSGEHPQGIPAQFRDVDLTAGDVSFTVRRGRAIRGHVLDAEGRPVPAMAVEAFTVTGDTEYIAHTATDTNGRFALQGVPTSETIHVQLVNRNDVLMRDEVPAGGNADLQLRFLPTAAISGEVRVPEGEEVGGLAIIATPIPRPSGQEVRDDVKAMIGPEGHFVLECVEGRRYLLRLEHNDRFAEAVDGGSNVAAGTRDALLMAKHGVSYTGTFARDDGAPPQTYVVLRPRDPEPGWEGVDVVVQTEEDGTFRIDGLDPAVTYRVSARDYPYGGWIQYPDVRLTERGLHGVTLKLE